MAKVFEHIDKLGRPLNIGDIVVVPYSATSTLICRITKMTAVMLTVAPVGKTWTKRKFPNEVVYIGEVPEIILYLLNQ